MTVTIEKARGRPRKLNETVYGELLARTRPIVIASEAEYERANALIGDLLKKQDRSAEEDRLLDLLTALVEKYDEEHHEIPEAAPHEVIRLLMEERNLRNRDLEPVLGSRGVTSDVINGRRKPSKNQAKALAKFFKVAPDLFLSFE